MTGAEGNDDIEEATQHMTKLARGEGHELKAVTDRALGVRDHVE